MGGSCTLLLRWAAVCSAACCGAGRPTWGNTERCSVSKSCCVKILLACKRDLFLVCIKMEHFCFQHAKRFNVFHDLDESIQWPFMEVIIIELNS